MPPPVLLPREDFLVTEVSFRLRDRPAADAGEDKLVDELVSGSDFFGELTSRIALAIARARAGINRKA